MILSAASLALGLALGLGPPDPRAPRIDPGARDRPAAVARLLAERCADCHSPGSDEPKAVKHWDGALDLTGTAQDPDLIVAGEPDDSELFLAISFEDMPPPDSGVEPFSEGEKALIAAWIRDGAEVLPRPDAPPDAPAVSVERHPPERTRASVATWVSHFHPVMVHFPVALLVAAALAELLARLSGSRGLRTAATFCLTLGALSALPSAGLGWLLAEGASHQGRELLHHRWLGVSTAVFSLVVLWGGAKRPALRLLMLLALAGLVGATGHTGGTLTYGVKWLQWPG